MWKIICNKSLRFCSKPQMKKETSENSCCSKDFYDFISLKSGGFF